MKKSHSLSRLFVLFTGVLPVLLSGQTTSSPDVSLSAPADIRAVVGSTVLSDFGVTNLTASETNFDINYSVSSTNNTVNGLGGSLLSFSQPDGLGGISVSSAPGTPWLGASLGGNLVGSVRTSTSLGSSSAGDNVTINVTASNENWNSVPTATKNIQVVENRLLTGALDINKGRHMVGLQPIGAVTLNGGTWADSEATRVSVHSGGYAQFSNGLRLTSASDFTFNGANQTHDLQVAYNGPTGEYAISNMPLPGAGASTYTDASGNERQDFGGDWKTSAEYGNILQETRIFTEEDRTGWSSLGGSRVWRQPDASPISQNAEDFIHKQELVETAQPDFLEVRTARIEGVRIQWELDRGQGPLVNERINPLVTGEVIAGSSLDLSGVTLQVSGTAVTDRKIGGGQIHLGRQMLGAEGGSIAVSRSDAVTLTTDGGDAHRTRITLNNFNEGGEGAAVSAVHAASVLFDGEAVQSSVNLAADFTINTSIQGQGTQFINAGGFITGEGLVGENVQSVLNVGYTWNNVLDNELTARNLLIIERDDAGSRSYATWVSRVHSTKTHTDIGWTGNVVSLTDSFNAGAHDLGIRTVSAIAEGLAGENANATDTFETRLAVVSRSAFTATHDGAAEAMTGGDKLTITDTGVGIYQNKIRLEEISISGGENLDYALNLFGGGASFEHGDSRELEIIYTGDSNTPESGDFGRVSRARLNIKLGDTVDATGILNQHSSSEYWASDGPGSFAAASFGSTSLSFNLETNFDAPAAASASTTVVEGTSFAVSGLTLSNTAENTSERFQNATNAELRDSEKLAADTEVNLSFVKLADATSGDIDALENANSNAASVAGMLGGSAEQSAFASDIVQLSGLNGILHVIEVTFDTTNILSQTGFQLVWKTENDGTVAWVNAVLGNSNISNLDLVEGSLFVGDNEMQITDYLLSTRHAGSYEDYLSEFNLSAPELGAWGIDYDNNRAWAAIDHNSDFAVAVPESAAYGLISGMLALVLVMCRRRVRKN